MRICIAQIEPIKGDIQKNLGKPLNFITAALAKRPDLIMKYVSVWSFSNPTRKESPIQNNIYILLKKGYSHQVLPHVWFLLAKQTLLLPPSATSYPIANTRIMHIDTQTKSIDMQRGEMLKMQPWGKIIIFPCGY